MPHDYRFFECLQHLEYINHTVRLKEIEVERVTSLLNDSPTPEMRDYWGLALEARMCELKLEQHNKKYYLRTCGVKLPEE